MYFDPFPECEPFSTLIAKQVELTQEVGQATGTEALAFLQKLLHSSKLELDSLVKQGESVSNIQE